MTRGLRIIEVLGGYGYIRDYPVERMYRDAKLTQIFEESNHIQMMIIGGEIMKSASNSR